MNIQELDNAQISELVNEMLPRIEQDIRNEIEEQLKYEYEQKLTLAAEQIEQNALNELDAIFMEVQGETQKQFEDKLKELDAKERQIDEDFNNIEEIVRRELEEKVRNNFEEEKKTIISTIIEEINTQGNSDSKEL